MSGIYLFIKFATFTLKVSKLLITSSKYTLLTSKTFFIIFIILGNYILTSHKS